MTLVLVVAGAGLTLLALFTQQTGERLSQVFLPLTASVLIASLHTLAFPPFAPSLSGSKHWRRFLLFFLSVGAFLSVCGLVLLDLVLH